MKKTIAWILAVTVLLATGITPAKAASEEEDDVGVYVIYTSRNKNEAELENVSSVKAYTSSRVHDLSASNMPYDFTIAVNGSNQTGLFKTNTTKVYVMVDPYADCYLKVELLDSNGNSLAERTLSIRLSDERVPTVTFTNLTASKNYKVKITNYSQIKVRVGGGVRDSFF